MNPSSKFHLTKSLCIATLAVVLALPVAAATEDNVKISNDQARVLFVTSAPNVKSALHEHTMNRVMVYLDEGTMTLTSDKGKVETLKFKAGQALWSPSSGMHVSENTSGHPVRIVEIELKSKPGKGAAVKYPALDPLKVDRKRYKLDFENDQVRVFHAKYGPHDKGVMHEHLLNRAVVFVTGGNMKVTADNGEVKNLTPAPGDLTTGAAAKHTEENVSDKPFEVVVVEFKK